MKIFLICSKVFYDRVPKIKEGLDNLKHEITLPNSFDNPKAESEYKNLGTNDYIKWKASMLELSENIIKNNDAVLVLNFNKEEKENYIGGATFLEMYEAFKLNKKIFLYNDIPEGMLKDEIISFSPLVINGDINKII